MAKKDKTKLNVYDESSIEVIKDDIQRLRKRKEMYIGYSGTKAFLHVIKEILQNSIDEAVAVKQTKALPAVEIWIYYNQKKKTVRIVDNGRGIPISKIIDICTYIQSSGKFNKGGSNAYKYSAGLNGVGATATNALSEEFTVIVCRDGIKHRCKFKKGVLAEDKDIGKSKEHGTDIEFYPDHSILGEVDLDYTLLLELAETMSHLSRTKIHVHVTGIPGKDGDVNKTYKSNGIVDALIDLAGKEMLVDPIYISKMGEDKMIEIAMTYVTNLDGENVLSYANYCTTVDHGTPLVGVKQGLTQVLSDYVKENCMNKKEKETLQITGEDCRGGWVCIINTNHIDPSFVGQVKEKINNPDLVPFAKSAIVNGMKAWLNEHDKDAKKLGGIIKKLAKIRLEGQKIRKQSMPKEISVFTINPRKYSQATGTEDLELIMIEGDSPKGLANQARDKTFQELFAFKGVPLNTYGLKYMDIKDNNEFRLLIAVMGMDIGPKKDITKRKHERYIIMTDADIDGNRITSIIAIFFLIHYPEIVAEGRLYKAQPPLYSCKKPINGSKYIQNNKDLNKIIKKAVSSKHTIYSYDLGRKLKESDINKLLEANNHYLRELTSISNKVSVHPLLIEFILSADTTNPKDLAKMINKEFRFMEARCDKKKLIVEGVYDKKFQYAVINDKLLSKTMSLKGYIEKNKKLFGFKYKVDDEDKTLYELIKLVDKFVPEMGRFKGLGEMQYTQLRDTTLDPDKRELIRLTSDDIKKDIENFALLHSSKKKDSEARAKLFAKYDIDIDDIDN